MRTIMQYDTSTRTCNCDMAVLLVSGDILVSVLLVHLENQSLFLIYYNKPFPTADALMLDLNGFVSETNATNVFMVDDGVLMTPHADHCLPGITRETILILAKEIGIETVVRNISLAEFHAADEVFTSGTMGELTPVTMIDGRVIGTGVRGAVTSRLQEVYSTLPERPGWSTVIPPFK